MYSCLLSKHCAHIHVDAGNYIIHPLFCWHQSAKIIDWQHDALL